MSTEVFFPKVETWSILQNSRNLAANLTLSTGLASSVPDLRRRCLESLLHRKQDTAYLAIMQAWKHFNEADFALLRKHGDELAPVVQKLYENGTLTEKRLAINAIAQLDLNRAVDILLNLVISAKHALSPQAVECLLQLCERSGRAVRLGIGKTPSSRSHLVDRVFSKMIEHPKVSVLVEAWLSLAHWDDASQRSLLADPGQPAYQRMLACFAETKRTAVLQLLSGYYWRSATPNSIMQTLIERDEPLLAIEMAKLVSEDHLYQVVGRLRETPSLRSFEHLDVQTLEVDRELERKLLLMQVATTDGMERSLQEIIRLSKAGTVEYRKLAAELLHWCRQPDLEVMIPAMQAASLDLNTKIPNLLTCVQEVVGWLSSPSVQLRRSAKEFLGGFTLENLLEKVRHWPLQMCRVMADVVSKTEPNVARPLIDQLESPSPKKRLAALQVVELLDCVGLVEDALQKLIHDPRLEIRVRVIDLLSATNDAMLEQILPELLQDASTDINDAANRAIRKLSRNHQDSI